MAKEKEKKKKGGGTIAGAALLLALLGGGGYFGLGVGNPNGGLINPAGSGAAAQEATTAAPAASSAEAVSTAAADNTTGEDLSVLTIRITEDKIIYRGQEVSLTELEEALLRDYTDGRSVVIQKEKDILSTYNEVEALVNRLRIPLMTTQANP